MIIAIVSYRQSKLLQRDCSAIDTKYANRIHRWKLSDKDDDKCDKVNEVVGDELWWCSANGKKVEHANDCGAEFATGGVLPAMIELFPPGTDIVRGCTESPVGGKRVSLDPVEDVKGDDSVGDVNESPCVKVKSSGKETDQKANSGYDPDVKRPSCWSIEPFHTDVVGLRAVACLHGPNGFALGGDTLSIGRFVVTRRKIEGSGVCRIKVRVQASKIRADDGRLPSMWGVL